MRPADGACLLLSLGLALLLGLGGVGDARADGSYLLRIATVAPDGTSYARVLRAFAREVEQQTRGNAQVKIYFGGIAGDDIHAAERIRRAQLDGVMSSTLCESLAPSMRALHLQGVYRDREEWSYVLNRLRPIIDDEMRRAGFISLGESALGPVVILSRSPIHSFADLRALRGWVSDVDPVGRTLLDAAGLHPVALPLEEADRAYLRGEIDGFFAAPTAILAFQWSVHGGYIQDLRLNQIATCLILSQRAFDQLPLDAQGLVRSAGAKALHNFENVARDEDERLLGGLLERQGVHGVKVNERLRSDWSEAAGKARERLGEQIVPRALAERVQQLLADYRREHPRGASR